MHRMNANRVSNLGTSSSLSDSSVQRIKAGIEGAAERRSQRRASKTMKKTAGKQEESKIEDTGRLVVASIKDIPDGFERVGTGFFRNGHHLWELTRAEGGYVLVRKQGEDHVLDYDHEPLEKQSNKVLDRRGVELRKGSKVRFPYRGKVATGTVVIVTPSALGIDTGAGGAVDVPPDMLESFVEEEKAEGGHSPEVMEGLEGFAEEEEAEEAHEEHEAEEGESDKEGMSAFAPEVEPSSKAEVAPAVGPSAGQPMSMMAQKEGCQVIITMPDGKEHKIDCRPEDLNELALGLLDQLETWGGASVQVIGVDLPFKQEASIDLKDWKEYWKSVGQRVAQAKEYKPPKPKLTEAEKRERAKERRHKLREERKGLPKDVALPPRPKKAVVDGEKEAVYKEKLRLYEQLVDEFRYILTTEPLDPQEVPLADQFMQALDAFEEEKEKVSSEEEQEIHDELSLEAPSKQELEQQEGKGRKIVSMADLA